MPRRERAAGAGLEVPLEARGCRFVREFNRHDHAPRPMLKGIASRPGVVPIEALIDV